MPRAAGNSILLTGVHGQSAQNIPSFTLSDGTVVPAYVTKPGEDAVDGRNPLCAIWRVHTKTSDDVKITIWSEPTAQRMQIGGRRHAFVEAAADCETVAELRALWEEQGCWTLEKFAFASRWGLFTIDTPAACQDYARLKAAIEGLPAPVSEDEAEDAPLPLADENDDDAPLPAPEADEGDEPAPPVDEEDVAEAAPPPLEDEPADDDAMEEAGAPELLYRENDVVFARDGGEDHPATVVSDCRVGATTVRIKWRTGRTGEYDWPLSDVMALEDLPPRRPRREVDPAAPRRAKAPPVPRVTTFRVGDQVEARYLGDLGSYCAGTVAGINADGSFVIHFDDGDKDSNVRPGHVIARRPQLPAPVKNKRPPPRQRTAQPAEKRARPTPPAPSPPLEESDEEVEVPPPPDEGMPPPPPEDEGEEDEDDGGPALKFAFTPAGATVMQPVAAPVTPH
jgi:hypothetical protein